MIDRLFFARGNAKLKKTTVILSLPAGHSCPFAKICRSHADKVTGKIQDGPYCQFRCYAASVENLFRNVRESRWKNFELLKTAGSVIGMANLIEKSIMSKQNIKLVRFNGSGDFFSQTYFDAWLLVTQQHLSLTFYGYTKALPFWIKRMESIPSNMKLVASHGGTHDVLIDMFKLRSNRVVFSEDEAKKLGLEIDHDDSLCWKGTNNFATLLHNTQPKDSPAGLAWEKIKKYGRGGYKSDYFKHYEKNGKSSWVIVDGKHIHVKTILTPAVHVTPSISPVKPAHHVTKGKKLIIR